VDTGVVKQLPSGPDRDALLFDDSGGQGYVTGNDQFAGLHSFNNQVVGDVGAVGNRNDLDQLGRGDSHRLIRNQDQFDGSAPRGPEKNVLDRGGASIRIDPDAKRYRLFRVRWLGHQ
jgi:hypothetical protein